MNMSMMPVYYTTSVYNRRQKSKPLTKKQQEQLKEYNKTLKRLGLPARDSLVAKKTKLTGAVKSPFETTSYRRETVQYPSLSPTGISSSVCAKKETIKYTGTLIKGIATMHKSNAVPVINQEQMEEISRMRRG
jgi:hypothetical protein